MTIKNYSLRCGVNLRTVRKWIIKGYVPNADLERDYVPDSAKIPYTQARAKVGFPQSVFRSIVKATLLGKHVVPALYGMHQEEFNSYIEQLSEAGLIKIRVTDGVTYYDPTLMAEEKNEKERQGLIKTALEAITKAYTEVVLEKSKTSC